MSQENLNNLENAEILKLNLEKVEQKEVSQEELLNWLDNEGAKFKLETREELSKSNTVDLDQSTFEKIKNETNIEQDLRSVEKEVDQIIARAKENLAPISPYDVIPEMIDYYINNAPPVSLNKEVQIESHKLYTEAMQNDSKFAEADKLIKKIGDTNKEIWAKQKKANENILQEKIDREPDPVNKLIIKELAPRGIYVNPDHPESIITSFESDYRELFSDIFRQIYPEGSYWTREDRDNIMSKVKQKVAELYDSKVPGFSKGIAKIDNAYKTKMDGIKSKAQSLENIEEVNKKTDELRSRFLENKDLMGETEKTELYDQLQQSLAEQQSLLDASKELAQEELEAVKRKREDEVNILSLIQQERVSPEQAVNTSEQIVPSTEEIVSNHFLYKDVVPERSEMNEKAARQEGGELRDNYKNQAETYKEFLRNNPEKLASIKNEIRNSYQKAMELIGIPSSIYGNSETWIDWDLAKQAYLAKNPEKSNSNYKLGNPLEDDQSEVRESIVNRHVGWEVLGFTKHDPSFINSLDKNKSSYQKIVSLINEGVQSNKLSSYKLAELGKLLKENRT